MPTNKWIFLHCSAIDLFTHLTIPSVLFYHDASLGMLGVGESSMLLPSFLRGETIADLSFSQRLRKIYDHVRYYIQNRENLVKLNVHRHHHGYRQRNHVIGELYSMPIIVQSLFGFEYAQMMSPLIRLVGFQSDFTPIAIRRLPSSAQEINILPWLTASKNQVVFVSSPYL